MAKHRKPDVSFTVDEALLSAQLNESITDWVTSQVLAHAELAYVKKIYSKPISIIEQDVRRAGFTNRKTVIIFACDGCDDVIIMFPIDQGDPS